MSTLLTPYTRYDPNNPNAWIETPECLRDAPELWHTFVAALALALDAATTGVQPDCFAIWAALSSTGVLVGAPVVTFIPGGTGAPSTTEFDAAIAAMTTMHSNISTLWSPLGNGHSDAITKAAADWTAPGEVYV